MDDTTTDETSHPGIICHLGALALAAVLVVAYPLTMAPSFKLCLNHPNIASKFGLQFEYVYRPLIAYLGKHPYSRLDNLSFWYATEVWRIPMYRN
jgi:hypothetical protein